MQSTLCVREGGDEGGEERGERGEGGEERGEGRRTYIKEW